MKTHKNYKVETEHTEQQSVYIYDGNIKHISKLVATVTNGDISNNFIRARYLGREKFLVYRNPNKLGLYNSKNGDLFLVPVDVDLSDVKISGNVITVGETKHSISIDGFSSLVLTTCKCIEKGSPVESTEIADEDIWIMRGIVL